MSVFGGESRPAACLECDFLSVAGNECTSVLFVGDVSDDVYVVECLDAVVQGEWHGEQEFVIFATIECSSCQIHVKFFGHGCSLIVDWDSFFVYAATCSALTAKVNQL